MYVCTWHRLQNALVLYQHTLRSCERQKEGPKRNQEDYIRMLFAVSKNTPAYMGLQGSLHWIDVKSINGSRHQVGFGPEVHKVKGLWLYASDSLGSSLFCLYALSSN